MPHSYGASFAADGRLGASNRDAPKLSAPNSRRQRREHHDRQILTHRCSSLSGDRYRGGRCYVVFRVTVVSRRCRIQHRLRKISVPPIASTVAG